MICPKHHTSTIANLLQDSAFDMLKNPAIKFCMAIDATFQQETDETIKTFPPVVLQSVQFEIHPDDNLDTSLNLVLNSYRTE